MTKTFQNKAEAMAWQEQYNRLAPQVGDLAPDFELSDIKGENLVRLSAFRDQKSVALIFGSFT